MTSRWEPARSRTRGVRDWAFRLSRGSRNLWWRSMPRRGCSCGWCDRRIGFPTARAESRALDQQALAPGCDFVIGPGAFSLSSHYRIAELPATSLVAGSPPALDSVSSSHSGRSNTRSQLDRTPAVAQGIRFSPVHSHSVSGQSLRGSELDIEAAQKPMTTTATICDSSTAHGLLTRSGMTVSQTRQEPI